MRVRIAPVGEAMNPRKRSLFFPRRLCRAAAPWLVLASITLVSAHLHAQAPANTQPPQAGEEPAASSMESLHATVPDSAATPGSDRLTPDERFLQVLNRFTYGPRPGDLERIRAQGLSKWFSAQLNPSTIDDSLLDRKLADYPAMQLPIERLIELYPDNAMIRATMNGRQGVPRGEGEKAIYNAQEARYKNKTKPGDKAPDTDPLPVDPASVLAMAPDDRFKALLKLTPAQFRDLRKATPEADRPKITEGFNPHQLEVLAALANPQGVVASEIVQTKLLRDIYSERQLNEVMVDFWLNHFNVYLRKSQEAPYLITSFERDSIRPRALGHFENLLMATAVSPAMLNYLDNASSIGPNSDFASPLMNRNRRGPVRPQATGLNENYARELMELHTLGVNGGYTQKDVTEVAKVFTGWTVGQPRGGGQPVHAEFDPTKHEPGDKMVLGVKVKQNGSREGYEVLHLLANSPQTAHFISTKLAIRFVSDDPPPAMVDRMAQTFLRTHGDIRQVLLTMVNSPEFFTRTTYRAKVKTPQDYVVSAVRASGADVQSAGALAATIGDLGMPIYGMQTPQGYSMRTDAWNNTAALVNRMNFALALSTNRVAGVHTDWTPLLGAEPLASLTPEGKDRLLEDRILHMSVSDRTRQTILSQITADPRQQRTSLGQVGGQNSRDALSTVRVVNARPEPVADPQIALAAGLLFGSPEFQRR
jgi:uncharacterized protein (DUF1800 family)